VGQSQTRGDKRKRKTKLGIDYSYLISFRSDSYIKGGGWWVPEIGGSKIHPFSAPNHPTSPSPAKQPTYPIRIQRIA